MARLDLLTFLRPIVKGYRVEFRIDLRTKEDTGPEFWSEMGGKPFYRVSMYDSYTGESVEGYMEKESLESIVFRTPPPSQYIGKRQFPQTYGDWVDLTIGIKDTAVARNDSATVIRANRMLGIIAVDKGDELTSVDDAKRWLVNKAGELGIT